MARANDLTAGVPMYCELEGCELEGLRVDGHPVYRFVCRGHAEELGLEVRDGFTPAPPPARTFPVAVFDAFTPSERGGPVRAVLLEQMILALEDALASEQPLEQVRELVRGMRVALAATTEELAPVVAPGF